MFIDCIYAYIRPKIRDEIENAFNIFFYFNINVLILKFNLNTVTLYSDLWNIKKNNLELQITLIWIFAY